MSSEGLVDSLAQHAESLSRAKFRPGNDFALTFWGIRLGPEPLLNQGIAIWITANAVRAQESSANGVNTNEPTLPRAD